MRTWGRHLLSQFEPVLSSETNGCFLVSCIQHGINAEIAGVLNATTNQVQITERSISLL